MDLGKNLAKARKEAGLSQKELAERLEVHQKDIPAVSTGPPVILMQMVFEPIPCE